MLLSRDSSTVGHDLCDQFTVVVHQLANAHASTFAFELTAKASDLAALRISIKSPVAQKFRGS